MRVTVTRQVLKPCPFSVEWDVGTLTIVWETDGNVPELHDLGHKIDLISSEPITHEQWTKGVQDAVPDAIEVRTEWRTGPWEVTVDAVPRNLTA